VSVVSDTQACDPPDIIRIAAARLRRGRDMAGRCSCPDPSLSLPWMTHASAAPRGGPARSSAACAERIVRRRPDAAGQRNAGQLPVHRQAEAASRRRARSGWND